MSFTVEGVFAGLPAIQKAIMPPLHGSGHLERLYLEIFVWLFGVISDVKLRCWLENIYKSSPGSEL